MVTCPKCGQDIQIDDYSDHYDVCPGKGQTRVVHAGETRIEKARVDALKIIEKHDAIDAVYKTLYYDQSTPGTTLTVLWQDFVAAWNRRGILDNNEAALLGQISFYSS
jgi:hypothetical protein